MLKKILKAIIFIILALLIGVILFGYFNFIKDKYFNKDNKNSLNNVSITQDNNALNNNNNSDSNNSNKNIGSNSEKIDFSNKKYDPENFDLSILLYEGEKEGKEVRKMLDRVISNADDNLYSNTSVTFNNYSASYSYELDNKDEYKAELENIKNNISDGLKYNISFNYTKLKSHVNEIIIEQK